MSGRKRSIKLNSAMSASRKIYVIAEMACSHEGDPGLARTIIEGAGNAGADAVQFQIWRYVDVDVPGLPDAEARQKVEMPREVWRELTLFTRVRYPTMQIIACVSDASTVDFAESIGVDAFKLHSSDLSNPALIARLARSGRRIDLSIGASTVGEIQTALEWIGENGRECVWLMYGFQNFPTRTDEVHLRYMMKLRDLFELPIGYRDHSDGGSDAAFWLPAAAIGMGVDVIEKHITHDRSKRGVDYQAALDPGEFSRFVEMCRVVDRAAGSAVPKSFSDEELKYRKYAKKSLVATRDLRIGEEISTADVRAMRARTQGLPPDRVDELIGAVMSRDVGRFDALSLEDVGSGR